MQEIEMIKEQILITTEKIEEFRNKVKNYIRNINKQTNNDGLGGFFKELKEFTKERQRKDKQGGFSLEIINLNIRDFIIFSIGDKIKEVIIDYKYKQPIIPFDKIFLEYFFHKEIDNGIATCDGILLTKQRGGVVVCSTKWTIWDLNKPTPVTRLSHLLFKEEDILQLTNEVPVGLSEDGILFGRDIYHQLKYIIQKFITIIDKKEYTTYKKWTHQGLITKEIVFAHDVKTHKRHFWNDTGYYKIPNMNKEEILSKGYHIDELVYKDGELKRDVPYTIIGEYIVNEDKERLPDNRKIELLKGKVFRKEEELRKVLEEMFPNDFIKRHDRKQLKGLELDYYIPKHKLGFEYDGEQHFDKKLCEDVFKSNFEELQKRDRKKDVRCRKKGITLIRIKYDENISKRTILRKIKQTNGRN